MFPIVFGVGALVWFTLGIASVTTMAIGLVVTIVFAIRIVAGAPDQNPLDIWYGIVATLLLVWALRPNIKKLLAGTGNVW